MTHIMFDLETWGKKPGSDIRSIGAVVFDPVAPFGWSASDHTIMNGETFYIATDNPQYGWNAPKYKEHGSSKYPLTRDPETVQWWNEQDINARLHAFANPVDLRDACEQFGIWLCGQPHGGNLENLRLWANDPHFDVSILAAVYDVIGLPVPWHYRAPRSMKTVCDLAGMTRDDYCNYGTGHHSLDDSIAQAMTVCEAYKRLGLRR